MDWWRVVGSIIGIIVVIVAAYFTTYLLATRGVRKASGGGIRLVDNFAMSKDKSVCALEISGRVYIVAMSSGAVALLDTLDAEEYLRSAKSAPASPVSFEAFKNASLFTKFMDAARRGSSKEAPEPEPKVAREEDDLDVISRKIETRWRRPDSGSDDGEGER